MRRKLFYKEPKITVLQLEEKENIIRTSPVPDVDNEDEWTGFY